MHFALSTTFPINLHEVTLLNIHLTRYYRNTLETPCNQTSSEITGMLCAKFSLVLLPYTMIDLAVISGTASMIPIRQG